MKNTVKKILALVFAVVMVCSLAVPALAADEKIEVEVKIVGRNGEILFATDDDTKIELTAKNQNVEKALKDELVKDFVTVSTSTGKVTALKVGSEMVKVTDDVITGEFGTGSVVVALNGAAVSEDLATVAVEDGDKITVYWADSTIGTKLAMIDDSRLDEGIVSLYYVDAEGNRQPLKGAYITLRSDVLKKGTTKLVLRDKTNVVNPDAKDVNGDYTNAAYEYKFVTDEKGQIWIAPEYLSTADIFTVEYAITNVVEYDEENKVYVDKVDTVATVIADAKKAVTKDDGYTTDEVTYYNNNRARNVEDVEVIGYKIVVDADMYNTADATGDMTMVYVLVAAAAVITLAAVVVMKKKAVKAN